MTPRKPARAANDGPIETPDGTRRWYKDGKLHRDDGPAYEGIDGTKMWFANSQIHRIGGPAIIHPDGSEEFWIKGQFMTPAAYDAAMKRAEQERRDRERAEAEKKQRAIDDTHEKAANDSHGRLRDAAKANPPPKIGRPPKP
jgi:hypothetical protein